MTVVLLILKIIGVLLLLLLAVILLVLFVPVRYRALGSYHTELKIELRVSWLLHLVTFGLDMLPGQNDMYLRIFGIKKILTKADNTEEFEDTIEEIAKGSAVDIADEAEQAAAEFVDASVEREKADVTEQMAKKSAGASAEREKADEAEDTSEESAKADKTKKIPDKSAKRAGRGFHPLRGTIQKIKDSYARIKAAVIRIFAVAERVRGLIADDRNRQAVRFVGGRLLWLLKRMMPKHLHLCLTYSTGSPDTTGEVLGVLALFPIGYEQRWNITPDFTADHFYADAEFDVKGCIFLYQVVWTALSVLLDKNCRRLYNEIKNGS